MIFQKEEKILKFLKDNISIMALICVVLINMIIRWSLRDFTNSDLNNPLTSWYNELKATGGFAGLGHQLNDCSYNLPYLTLIAIFTYLPINPVDAFKISSGIFDYVQAIAVAKLVYEIVDVDKKNKAIVAFMIAISSPLVLLNSAGWGQCDSIYTAFTVLALIYLYREKFLNAFILLGTALAFKLQAVFIMPLFLYYYFTKRKFSIIYFGILPLVMEVLSLPAIIAGRGIFDVFKIYLNQTDWYPKMSMNYPTFWNLLNNEYTVSGVDTYAILKIMAVLMVVLVLGVFLYACIYRNVEFTVQNMIYIAFLCVFTCVEFLPGMHERYGYTAEILMIIMLFINIKVYPIAIGMLLVGITTYGNFLFDQLVDFTTMSWINSFVYFGALLYIIKEVFKTERTTN